MRKFAGPSLHPAELHLPQPGQGKNPGNPLPCDSDPGQTIANTASLKSAFLVSKCMGLVIGKRAGKEAGASQPCCCGQCLEPGAGSHFLPHGGSVTGSCQSLMAASCQETSLCFRLSSPFPAGTSLPQEVAHGDSRTAQGGPVLPSQSLRLHMAELGQWICTTSPPAELVTPSLSLTCSRESGRR